MIYFCVVLLILLSGLFSGLNLGLMGLSTQELKRKARLGNKDAKKIYPLRKTGNFLLVTLLLGNVAVNTTIAILMGSVTSGFIAGIISTGLITIFGEIVPQATFSHYALKLGAKFTWLVKIFMYGLYPFTKPIAWLLDKFLGAELNTVYSKMELIEIIEEHRRSQKSNIIEEEEKIIKGALTFAEKKIGDIMTPEPVMMAFEESIEIDEKTIKNIIDSGLSRFPVYKTKIDNIIGILHLRDVVKKNNFGKKMKELVIKKFLIINPKTNLASVFSKLLKGRHLMAIVKNEFGTTLGLVTLEDIIEEIIQDEIVDEDDKFVDMRKLAKR